MKSLHVLLIYQEITNENGNHSAKNSLYSLYHPKSQLKNVVL